MEGNKVAKKIKYALRFIPDSIYVKIYYFARFKRLPNLKNPKTYNEKLNWLKLNDKNPIYTTIVDKYEAKKYISNIIGEKYIIQTLGVWDRFDDINFDELPKQFVLKCTHDSGGIVIVKDKDSFDKVKAKKKLESSLETNFYYICREWPYKNIKPRIIAEKYIEDTKTKELRDYKFFCFNGEPKIMLIVSGRYDTEGPKLDYFDMDFNHLDIIQDRPNAKYEIKKPVNFEKMIELSKKLSENMIHVRVDFYEVDGNLYLGEITLYHHGGYARFSPKKWDKIIGDWLKLPTD